MKQTTKSVKTTKEQHGQQGQQESSWQVCQHHSKNVCRLGCLALYCILYMTLSSNPKVMDTRNDHSMDLPSLEQLQQVRQSHIQKASSMIARKFTPVSPNQWCLSNEFRFEQAKREPMGLCYLNIPETKSDVVQGITERIAQNFLQRQESGTSTSSSCIRHHGPTPGTYYQRREKLRSFLFTMVRDPTERAMARVASTMLKQRGKRASFFTVPRATGNTTTDNTTTSEEVPTEEEILSQQVLSILQSSTDVHYGTVSEGRGGFQLQYSMLHIIPEYSAWNASQPNVVQKPEDVQRRVQRVLEGYNFVGVVERMDESLVALQLLLGLETQDILYFTSQLTPKYHRRVVPGSSGKHHYCQEQFKDGKNWLWTPAVEEYLQSTTWWAQNYGDFLLHEAASQSLDRTIHNEIGYKPFAAALRDFHRWMNKANEECHPVYPCSANGTDQFAASEQNCYPNHLACGYPCLDGLMKKKEETPPTAAAATASAATATTQAELDSNVESPTTGTGSSNKKTKKTKQQKTSITSSTTTGGDGFTTSANVNVNANATLDGTTTGTSSTSYGTRTFSNNNNNPTTNDDTTGNSYRSASSSAAATTTTTTTTSSDTTGTSTGGSTSTATTGKKKKSTSTSSSAGTSAGTTTTATTSSGTATTGSTPKKKSTGKRTTTSTSTTTKRQGNPSW